MGKKYNGKVRVLVVDDSAYMRKVISDILNSDDDIEVIDTAKNGADAIEKAKTRRPDVITLDVNMPGMNGIDCLKEICKIGKLPIIMLSSITEGVTESTIQALAEGAIDFVTKPSNIFDMNKPEKRTELIEKVKVASSSLLNQRSTVMTKHNTYKYSEVTNLTNIVLIGTSTGGPKALQEVIPLIPENANATFLVVQHMPSGFTKSLANRLDLMSKVTVKEAEDNDEIKTGCVYIAPGDYHMIAKKSNEAIKIKLTKDPPVGNHRPSVDAMFESVSNTGFKNIVAVIMTGMGADGSKAIKLLKQNNNANIIAQDEGSCIVFGMPKAAIQTGVVDCVTPLKGITNEIMKIVGVHN